MAFICSQHSAVKDPKYITLEQIFREFAMDKGQPRETTREAQQSTASYSFGRYPGGDFFTAPVMDAFSVAGNSRQRTDLEVAPIKPRAEL